MPTIPDYNLSATEEAGLTRVKRRVLKQLESGIVKLTERPDQDLTNGKADDIALKLIGLFEDLTALFRQIVSNFGEYNIDNLEKDGQRSKHSGSEFIKYLIFTAKVIARILRVVKALVPVMRFLDLGILSDLKAVQNECYEAAKDAFGILEQTDFEEAQREAYEAQEILDNGREAEGWEWLDDVDVDAPPVDDVDFDVPDPRALVDDTDDSSLGSILSRSSRGSRTFSASPFGSSRDSDTFSASPMPSSRDSATFSASPFGSDRSVSDLTSRSGRSRKSKSSKSTSSGVRRRVDSIFGSLEDAVKGLRDTRAGNDAFGDKLRIGVNLERERKVSQLSQNTLNSILFYIEDRYNRINELLDMGYANFNQFRQQRVLPAKEDDVGTQIKTAAGMHGGEMVQGTASRFYGVTPQISNIYRIGGSTDILYRREGLPRFL
jgi:hypothetical protein